MAVSTLTTPLPRRAVIAGAAACAASTIAPGPSEAGTVSEAITVFSVLVARLREAQAACDAMERKCEAIRAAISPCPALPRELCETFSLPDKPHAAKPGPTGWSAKALRDIARGQYWDRNAGWMYFLAENHPIRRRAVELLPVREAYDAARAQWEKEASAIDELIREPLAEEDRRAFEVIRHPVFTLHEVRLKISIAQETYLFDHAAGDEARDAILRDVLAIANEEGRA